MNATPRSAAMILASFAGSDTADSTIDPTNATVSSTTWNVRLLIDFILAWSMKSNDGNVD